MGTFVSDEDYMRIALEEARAAAAEGEVPIGAVVVSGGERVCRPVSASGDAYAHRPVAAGVPAADSDTMPITSDAMDSAMSLEDEASVASDDASGVWGIEGGKVIARAHNRRETDRDPSAHAEFAAMTAAAQALDRWRLMGCTVYVTLEPCLMCAGLMVNARVDRCVFGAPDPKGGALGTLYDVSHDERLNHEFEVAPGVLAGECADELRAFFRARRAAARALRTVDE